METKNYLLIAIFICFGFQCCVRIKGHEIWKAEIPKSGSGTFKFDPPISLPEGVIVTLSTADGFDSWNDVLNNYDGYNAELAITQTDGSLLKFHLSVAQGDPLVSLFRHQRDDHKSDLGWRLHRSVKEAVSLKIENKGDDASDLPTKLVLETMP